jgi:hypothetical protein
MVADLLSLSYCNKTPYYNLHFYIYIHCVWRSTLFKFYRDGKPNMHGQWD